MPLYTHDQSTGNRTLQEVGQIGNTIHILAPDSNKFMVAIGVGPPPQDPHIIELEDALDSVALDNAHGELDPAPEASDTSRSKIQQYCQLLYKTAEVSDVQNKVRQYGMASEFAYQKAKKLLAIKADLECIALSAQSGQEAAPANNNTWLMNGVGAIISTHTNTTFNEGNLDTMLTDIVEDGGQPELLLCDATRKAAINALTTNVRRFTSDTRSLDKQVELYTSDVGGPIALRHHSRMPVTSGAPNVLVLDLQWWGYRFYMRLYLKTLPDEGAGPRQTWKVMASPVCTAEKAQGQFYNL